MNHYCKDDEIPMKKVYSGPNCTQCVNNEILNPEWILRTDQSWSKIDHLKKYIHIYSREKKMALSLTILFQNSEKLWNSLPLIHSLLVIFPQVQVLLQEAAETNPVEHVLGKTSRTFPKVRVHRVSAKVPRMRGFFFRIQSLSKFLSSG